VCKDVLVHSYAYIAFICFTPSFGLSEVGALPLGIAGRMYWPILMTLFSPLLFDVSSGLI
jgi:hypothetical protein